MGFLPVVFTAPPAQGGLKAQLPPRQRGRPGLLAPGAAALWGEPGTAARTGAGPRDRRGTAAQGMLRSQGRLRRPLPGALGSKSLMLSRERKVLG